MPGRDRASIIVPLAFKKRQIGGKGRDMKCDLLSLGIV